MFWNEHITKYHTFEEFMNFEYCNINIQFDLVSVDESSTVKEPEIIGATTKEGVLTNDEQAVIIGATTEGVLTEVEE